MSKTLRITLIVTAIVVVLAALGFGLGFGLTRKDQGKLTINVDGENVEKIQLEPGDNVYEYVMENLSSYTDFNTCGWFVDESMTTSLTNDTKINENMTIYTRTATMDKLKFTLNDDEATYSVSAVSEDITGEVVIPRMYNDAETSKSGLVTKVADNGFGKSEASDNLTLVAMPNSIETIGTQAFYYNRSLTFTNIPYGVKTIGEKAFRHNYSIVSITIPETVTSIGDEAFYIISLAEVYNYSGLNIELGVSGNGNAGYFAKVVYNASDLTGAKPESKIKTIGNMNYYVNGKEFVALAPTESRAEAKNVVLDKKTTEINAFAFNYCTALETINIPKNIQKIGRCAFQQCNSLSSEIVIPEGVTEIGEYSFNNCYSLTSVTIPDSVQSIGKYAFYHCTALTSIHIPDGVTEIADFTFGYSGLTSIDIPDSVTRIGANSFMYTNLRAINIPDSVTSIGEWAFAWCENAKELKISENVTALETYTFQHLGIKTLVIPKNITSFGMAVFNGCKSLEEVVFENQFTTVSEGMFLNCSSLKSITIPEGVTRIERIAFQGSGLETIILPESLEYIGNNAFWACESLKSIKIPKNVSEFGNGYEFNGCANLTDVTIDSAFVYTSATSNTAASRLLEHATTVKVLASIVDDPENTNNWLNGSAWKKSEVDEEGYYTFTRV